MIHDGHFYNLSQDGIAQCMDLKDGSIVWLRDEKYEYNAMMSWNGGKQRWEGRSYQVFGPVKTTWDESFVAIHEWAHVES